MLLARVSTQQGPPAEGGEALTCSGGRGGVGAHRATPAAGGGGRAHPAEDRTKTRPRNAQQPSEGWGRPPAPHGPATACSCSAGPGRSRVPGAQCAPSRPPLGRSLTLLACHCASPPAANPRRHALHLVLAASFHSGGGGRHRVVCPFLSSLTGGDPDTCRTVEDPGGCPGGTPGVPGPAVPSGLAPAVTSAAGEPGRGHLPRSPPALPAVSDDEMLSSPAQRDGAAAAALGAAGDGARTERSRKDFLLQFPHCHLPLEASGVVRPCSWSVGRHVGVPVLPLSWTEENTACGAAGSDSALARCSLGERAVAGPRHGWPVSRRRSQSGGSFHRCHSFPSSNSRRFTGRLPASRLRSLRVLGRRERLRREAGFLSSVLTRGHVCWFQREGGRQGGGENISVREKCGFCLLHTPLRGPNLQPRPGPWWESNPHPSGVQDSAATPSHRPG